MNTDTYRKYPMKAGQRVIISWRPCDPMCARFVGKVGTIVARCPDRPDIWRICLLHPVNLEGQKILFVDVREGEALSMQDPPHAHAEYGPNPYILHQAGKLRD